jgi:predicted aspartyl protease
LAKLLGAVDHRGRPVVRVAVVGREDEVLATIDTGFNGEVMIVAGDAVAVGVAMRDGGRRVELGHGESVDVRTGRLRLRWLNLEQEVSVLIGERREPSREGEPIMLIGTRLLSPHLLLVDFGSGTVEIETQ